MALRRRSERASSLIWPGFVDAMTALLLVLMFVLTIFLVVQYVLQDALSGRDRSLAILGAEIQALNRQLSISEEQARAFESQLAERESELAQVSARARQLAEAVNRSNLQVEELTADLAARVAEVSALTLALEERAAERDTARAALADLQDRAAQIAAVETENAELRREALTLEERVAALELRLDEKVREAEEALLIIAAAEAREAELDAETRAAAERLTAEERARAFAQAALQAEREAATANRRAVALLNTQLLQLREELAWLRGQLDAADAKAEADQAVISELGAQLNRALAQKVSELQRYRSEFFGRVREALGERAGVQIVGDRFVFQSEVLFATGSAELGADGRTQMSEVAGVIRDVARQIPSDVSWILRVDGHTDSRPIFGGSYRNNWELSQARALSVVEFLIEQEGLAPERLAPTGFGEFQPIDPRETASAYRRNRRIELKLTER